MKTALQSKLDKRAAGVRGSLIFPGLLLTGHDVVLVIVTYYEGGYSSVRVSQPESLITDGGEQYDTGSLGWKYICCFMYLSLVSTNSFALHSQDAYDVCLL